MGLSEAEKQSLITPTYKQRANQQKSMFRYVLVNMLCCLASLWIVRHAYQRAGLHKHPYARAVRLMESHPLIDGHIDLPVYVRYMYANQPYNMDLAHAKATTDVDIPRLRAGKVGGFFWSLFVPCANEVGYNEGSDFTNSSWRVRDTLEQFDVARILIDKYKDTFQFADTASEVRKAFKQGKVASLFGLEGAHQIGNSLSVLRQYRKLGARYMTLTHTCNNAFADSCGYDDKPVKPLHGGLSAFGKVLVKEMNRIGMMVDVSHTTAETAADVLSISEAPAIFTHSNARAVHDSVRNVPDYILERIGRADKGDRSKSGVKAGDALINANFVPYFLESKGNATLAMVADQIDYIGNKAGRRHVGIGSDFDGIGQGPRVAGLEDVSKYPNLIAELIRRGWSDKEVVGLLGENLLRIMDKVDEVAYKMRHLPAATEIYKERTDIPKTPQPH